MKLSPQQIRHLEVLSSAAGPRSAYPGLRLNTLTALEKSGLAKEDHSTSGRFSSPQNAIKWIVTDAGRAALAVASQHSPRQPGE